MNKKGTIRQISPVTIDGATRLEGAPTNPPEWAVRAAVRSRELGRPVMVHARGPAGERIRAEVSGGKAITVHVPGCVWVCYTRKATRVQAGADAMWAAGAGADGFRRWCHTWLKWVSRSAFHAEWKVTALEICADFTGFEWDEEEADPAVWIGSRKLATWSVVRDGAGAIQTISMGKRATAPLSVCLYDKGAEIGRKHDIYRRVHLRHGWDGKSERMRVEFRFRGPALRMKGIGRTPAEIADNLHAFWEHATRKVRKIVPGTASRKKRCAIDTTWATEIAPAASAPERPLERMSESERRKETYGDDWMQDLWRDRIERHVRELKAAAMKIATLVGVKAERFSDRVMTAAMSLATMIESAEPGDGVYKALARIEGVHREQIAIARPVYAAATLANASSAIGIQEAARRSAIKMLDAVSSRMRSAGVNSAGPLHMATARLIGADEPPGAAEARAKIAEEAVNTIISYRSSSMLAADEAIAIVEWTIA